MANLSWIITGASSGIGQALALAALRAGHNVIGTTRNASPPTSDKFSKLGGTWLTVDVNMADATAVIQAAAQKHNIDVLVNNAGYALLGALEDASDAEFHEQLEANFHGPLRCIRGVLPVMRSKKHGVIVNISSGAGFTGLAGRSAYASSKFALEGISESLFAELKPFGIRTLLVEPGAFRTPFSDAAKVPAAFVKNGGVSEAYRGTPAYEILQITQTMSSTPGMVKGDPERAAKAIIEAVVNDEFSSLRLPLGTDCIKALEAKIKWLQDDLNATRAMASSTDFLDA